ncbi:hypothetical protein [Clostridium sp.]|uniref:hypothetical protein n=1 Tax=Clostridium sp. TaxID=1506 RepID=UPI002605FADD|nr:hypothetical protein [Clostridium sp.]
MDSGTLIYKCRRCGKLSKNTHVPDGVIALSCIVNNIKTPKEWNGVLPELVGVCSCEDGNLGISDLIGFEKDKKEV